MARMRRPVHILIRAGANSLTADHVRRAVSGSEKLLGYPGISTVGVWPGEDPQDVWATDDRLRDRNAIWIADRTNLETYGFKVVKTTANARHFTVVRPVQPTRPSTCSDP